MDWFFDGLGTLLVGLVLGGAGGGMTGWRFGKRHTLRQVQKAGDNASQIIVSGDAKWNERKRG